MSGTNGVDPLNTGGSDQDPDDPFAADGEDGGSRFGRWLGLGVVVVLIVMWVLAFSGWRDPGTVDQLDDPAFALAAERVCQATRVQLDALPGAPDATSPADRGRVVSQASDRLEAMVAELRTLVPEGTDDGAAIGRWLDDWDVYLADRRAHEADLLDGKDVRFVVSSTENGSQVSKSIDRFAELANPMPTCATPGDLGG